MLRTVCLSVALGMAALPGLTLAAQTVREEPGKAADTAPQLPQPTVNVKEVAPVRVAFVEHQGPYWTLGPVFEVVRGAMEAMNEDGPMFVRFHGDPRKVPAADLESEVGFVVDGGAAPPAPLTINRRAAEEVAYVLAPGPHGTSSRFYGTLYSWAVENGYAPAGGPVEFYWGEGDKNAVEIQLPIVEAPKEPPPPPPAPAPAAEAAPQPGASSPPAETSPQPPVEDNRGDTAGADQRREPNAEPEASDSVEESAPEAPDGAAPASPAKEDTPNAGSASSRVNLEALFAAGKFEAIAKEVLPDGQPPDPETQAWIGQFAYRLVAIGRGSQQKFGDAGKPVLDLGEALLSRYRALLPEGADPLALAGRVGAQARPEHREIIRRADMLMGGLAVGTIDAEAVRGQVVQMLQDVRRMLRQSE